MQTSLDFTVITEKDDAAHRNAKEAIASLHRDLGLDDSREMTEDEMLLKAQQRAGSHGVQTMPSKIDLKRELERESRSSSEREEAGCGGAAQLLSGGHREWGRRVHWRLPGRNLTLMQRLTRVDRGCVY